MTMMNEDPDALIPLSAVSPRLDVLIGASRLPGRARATGGSGTARPPETLFDEVVRRWAPEYQEAKIPMRRRMVPAIINELNVAGCRFLVRVKTPVRRSATSRRRRGGAGDGALWFVRTRETRKIRCKVLRTLKAVIGEDRKAVIGEDRKNATLVQAALASYNARGTAGPPAVRSGAPSKPPAVKALPSSSSMFRGADAPTGALEKVASAPDAVPATSGGAADRASTATSAPAPREAASQPPAPPALQREASTLSALSGLDGIIGSILLAEAGAFEEPVPRTVGGAARPFAAEEQANAVALGQLEPSAGAFPDGSIEMMYDTWSGASSGMRPPPGYVVSVDAAGVTHFGGGTGSNHPRVISPSDAAAAGSEERGGPAPPVPVSPPHRLQRQRSWRLRITRLEHLVAALRQDNQGLHRLLRDQTLLTQQMLERLAALEGQVAGAERPEPQED